MPTPDKIEREVDINAPLDQVWQLVTEPGWWIGDGQRSNQSRRRDGELEVIDDPKYGSYPVRVEAIEPKRYVSYRWAAGSPGEKPGNGNSTLVEFWLDERPGGTVLRVVESGFVSLDVSEQQRAAYVEGNSEGWDQQLDIIRSNAESATV